MRIAVSYASSNRVRKWSHVKLSTTRHLAAVAYGAILERTMVGFLAPTPPGADSAGKLVQNVVALLVVLALGALLHRRTREPEQALRPAQ